MECSRIENLEVDLYFFIQFFTKAPRAFTGKWTTSSTHVLGKSGYAQEVDYLLHTNMSSE